MRSTILSLLIGVAIGLPVSVYGVHAREADRNLLVGYHYTVRESNAEENEVIAPSTPNRDDTIINADTYLLAALIQAEAGNQDMHGQRLVGSVVLNRTEDERFPDTIAEVIYQENQFSVVANGALDTALRNVRDDCLQAAREEIKERTDSTIKFFCCTGYNQYGEPAYRYEGHYFSR